MILFHFLSVEVNVEKFVREIRKTYYYYFFIFLNSGVADFDIETANLKKFQIFKRMQSYFTSFIINVSWLNFTGSIDIFHTLYHTKITSFHLLKCRNWQSLCILFRNCSCMRASQKICMSLVWIPFHAKMQNYLLVNFFNNSSTLTHYNFLIKLKYN